MVMMVSIKLAMTTGIMVLSEELDGPDEGVSVNQRDIVAKDTVS